MRLGQDPLHLLTVHGALDPVRTVWLHKLGDRALQPWPRDQNPVYFDALLEVCRQRGLEPDLADATPELSGTRSYRLRMGKTF